MKSLLSPIVLAALSAPAAAQPGVAPMPPPVESAPPHAGWPAPVHQPTPGSARATFMSTGETINLIREALPKVHVGPAQPYVTGNTVGLAGRF